jgi:HEAT repeat protein
MNAQQGRLRAAAAGMARRFRVRIGTLSALVASCALVFWWCRVVWEANRPVNRSAQALRSADAGDRQVGARELGAASSEDVGLAVFSLAAALGDANGNVRREVVLALASAGATAARNTPGGPQARAAARALLGAIKDGDAFVRAEAIRSLFTLLLASGASPPCDPRVVEETLAGALRDPDLDVRLAAVRGPRIVVSPRLLFGGGLGMGEVAPRWPPGARGDPPRLGIPTARPADLIVALRTDPSTAVRAEAATTLGEYAAGGDATISQLFDALEQDQEEVREACANAMSKWVAPSPALVPLLIEKLQGGRDPRVRCCAASLLGRTGPEAVAAVGALASAIREEPFVPARRVGRVDWEREFWDPTCWAIWALPEIAGPSDDAVAVLAHAVRSDSFGRRVAAVAALSRLGPRASAAAPALIAALKQVIATGAEVDGVPGEGDLTARAIASVAPDSEFSGEAVAALIAALDAAPLRYVAMESLRRFGPEARAAVPHLRALQRDSDQTLSEAASAALRAILQSDDLAEP